MPYRYARYVNKGVSRLETLLKVVRLPDSPPDALVAGYVDLVADRSFVSIRVEADGRRCRKRERGTIERSDSCAFSSDNSLNLPSHFVSVEFPEDP